MAVEQVWLSAEVSTTNCTLDCTRRRLEVEGEGGVALEREACGFTCLVDLLGGVGVRVEEEENGAHRDKKEEEGGFDYLRIETRNGRNVGIFSFLFYFLKQNKDINNSSHYLKSIISKF